jgi:two-component system sensor histidine kinase AlgZ
MDSTATDQKHLADALPDFRNLGVIARILIVVNIGMILVASIASDQAVEYMPALLATAVIVEPALLAALAVLYAANDWLARLRYTQGVAAVAGIAVICTEGAYRLSHIAGGTGTGFEHLRGLVLAILITFGFAEYFRLRNRALSPALVEARLQALQARIRPHFLFNSMNAVLSLIRTNPRRAEHALEDLADLFRTLMADSRKLVPLEDEIKLVRDYLDIEQLRLGERLVVQWRIEGAPKHALVPPLFLQPLVENAVYHGVEPGRGPGKVEIDIVRRDERIIMRLSNPYHPEHQHRQGNRMALANIKERLALHFDAEAQLTSGAHGDRYEIHIEIPYRKVRK